MVVLLKIHSGLQEGMSKYNEIHIVRRKLRSQTSDSMDRLKSRRESSQRREVRRERFRRKKIKAREKIEKSRNNIFSLMFLCSGASKSRLARVAGAEPSDVRSKRCTLLCSEHFCKLRGGNGVHGCGAKHVSKSKRAKCTIAGAFFEVEMLQKCMRLLHEVDFDSKRSWTLRLEAYSTVKRQNTKKKSRYVQTIFAGFNVEQVHIIVSPSTFLSQNARCQKSARVFCAKHISKSKRITTTKTPATATATTMTTAFNYNYTRRH